MKTLTLGALVVGAILFPVSKEAGSDSSARPAGSETTVRPLAQVETQPVPHMGDAADDAAFWINASDPGSSLLLGTDKRGLHAYDLDGTDRGVIADGSSPHNVDVLYGFDLDGRRVDLAVANVRGGVKVWSIDAATRTLTDVTAGRKIRMGVHGMCGYRNARAGRFYIFATTRSGRVDQWELKPAAEGKIGATRVRSFRTGGGVSEGCVADHELGVLYVASERKGIWKAGAEPDAGTAGQWIARVGENGLAADVKGLAIYYATGGRGYLLASSQGNDTFNVYQRSGDNRFLMTIDPAADQIDDVDHTDGIDVTNSALPPRFPRGVFVVQDGSNDGGHQNFKLYSWEDIAGQRLLVDTAWSPRLAPRRMAAAAGAGP